VPAVGPTERIRGGYDDETDNRRLLFFTGTGNEREFLTVLDSRRYMAQDCAYSCHDCL